MKNVMMDIFPDKYEITVTIGVRVQKHVFKNGPTEVKQIERSGDEFPEEVQDQVDSMVAEYLPFHIGDFLASIKE